MDLSVILSIDHPTTWPGQGLGNHRHPYTKADFFILDSHIMDSHAGTHLVPPAYALPPKEFEPYGYAPQAHIWLDEYEERYGPRGISDVTTEKVPLSQTCGWARVIDVRHLVGTTSRAAWPASPEITVEVIKKHEAEQGVLKAGEIVIFHSGHTDRHFQLMPAGSSCLIEPVNGKSEGWPAPRADAIIYLAQRGIKCVATDGPTLGGVRSPKRIDDLLGAGQPGYGGCRVFDRCRQATRACLLPLRARENPWVSRRTGPSDCVVLICKYSLNPFVVSAFRRLQSGKHRKKPPKGGTTNNPPTGSANHYIDITNITVTPYFANRCEIETVENGLDRLYGSIDTPWGPDRGRLGRAVPLAGDGEFCGNKLESVSSDVTTSCT